MIGRSRTANEWASFFDRIPSLFEMVLTNVVLWLIFWEGAEDDVAAGEAVEPSLLSVTDLCVEEAGAELSLEGQRCVLELTGKGLRVLLGALVEGIIVVLAGDGFDEPFRMEGFLVGSCVVLVLEENLLVGACVVAVEELTMLLLAIGVAVVLPVFPSVTVPVVEGLFLVFSKGDWR